MDYEFSYETTEGGDNYTTWNITRNFKATNGELADPGEFALTQTEIRILPRLA